MRIQHLLALALAAGGTLQAQAIELNEQFALAITPGLYSDYRNSGISQTLGDPAAPLDHGDRVGQRLLQVEVLQFGEAAEAVGLKGAL
jgi:hypothetical protein